MSSQRLPNKVLHEVAGKPMLQYVLERLKHCSCLDSIVVATSVDERDAPIAEFCRQRSVICFRGPLGNVAQRFKEVLDIYQFDGFVRINGDSPLLDQRLIEEAVGIFLSGEYDLVTNVLPRTYPKGQSVEVLRTSAYKQGYARMRESEDMEHVTTFFHTHLEDFKVYRFVLPHNLNNIQLSVDTLEDMGTFTAIVSKMSGPHWEYTLNDILKMYYAAS